jgi:hypothetical protein
VPLWFGEPINPVNLRNSLEKSIKSCGRWWWSGKCSDNGGSNMMILISHGGIAKFWSKSLDEKLPNYTEVYGNAGEHE